MATLTADHEDSDSLWALHEEKAALCVHEVFKPTRCQASHISLAIWCAESAHAYCRHTVTNRALHWLTQIATLLHFPQHTLNHKCYRIQNTSDTSNHSASKHHSPLLLLLCFHAYRSSVTTCVPPQKKAIVNPYPPASMALRAHTHQSINGMS